MYPYKESGLDNVYLENGFTIRDTPYGMGVSIQDTEGLHKAIGLWLTSCPKRINGAELRFIRLEMELTQKALAGLLGSEEQNVRLWEKARTKSIPGLADRSLRALYFEFVTGDGSIRRLVNRLAELDQLDCVKLCLRETDRGWESITLQGSPSPSSLVPYGAI